MAIQFGKSGEMAIVLKVKDDGSLVVEKFGDNSKKALDKSSRSAKKTEKDWKELGKTVGRAGAILATAASSIAVGSAVVGAKFEQEIANVASVAGASDTQLKQLSNSAREQAKVSIFSATQAAEAQYSLASAGLNVNQIIAAQSSVMTLAAATQSDLARTSEITTATLSQFNLTATDSDRVANVFAAAISGSQATLSKLGDSMRFVGPVAKALNIDLESTTAAVSLLFNAGFRGEQAGTILRSSLISLQKPSTQAAALIEHMGLKVNDVSGKFVGFGSLIKQLADKQLTLNEAATIFGTEAAPGMLAMVKQGATAYENMRKKITGTNKAQEQATKKTNTLTGDWKLLQSALEENALVLFGDIGPAVRAVTQEVTAMLSVMSNSPTDISVFSDSIKTILSLGLATAVTFKEVGTVIGGVVASIAQLLQGNFTGRNLILSSLKDDLIAMNNNADALLEKIQASRAAADATANAFVGPPTPDTLGSTANGDPLATGTGTGDREAQQTVIYQAALQQQIDLFAENQATKEDLLLQKYTNEQFLFDDALQAKVISDQQFQQLDLVSRQQFESAKTRLKIKEDKKRQKLEKNVNTAHLKAEKKRNQLETAGRGQVYTQGLNLLRRFADGNKAITLLLIGLRTAKTVSDIQTNATASAVMVVAYGQVEEAAIMAATAGLGFADAAAAVARAAASAASIEASALIATGLVIAGGVVDAIRATAGAPGSSTNPVNVTSTAPITPIDTAQSAINSSTLTTTDTTIQADVPTVFSPAQQQAVVDVPRELNITVRGSDVFTGEQFADGVKQVFENFLADGNLSINVAVV